MSCEKADNQEHYQTVQGVEELNLANVDGKILITVENAPEFPGGVEKMYEYIGQNLVYPKTAQRDNIQGKVFVKFVVTKDGDIG